MSLTLTAHTSQAEPQPSVLYYLGVRPERVQEKKYGYHFPDVEADDVGVKSGLASRTASAMAIVPRTSEVVEVCVCVCVAVCLCVCMCVCVCV